MNKYFEIVFFPFYGKRHKPVQSRILSKASLFLCQNNKAFCLSSIGTTIVFVFLIGIFSTLLFIIPVFVIKSIFVRNGTTKCFFCTTSFLYFSFIPSIN